MITSNVNYQIEEHSLDLDLKLPLNNIKPEIYYNYVIISRLLSKNPKKEDGLPSIP